MGYINDAKLAEENIDIESGIANCGGEPEFYVEIIEAFEEEDKRGELLTAYANEDWKRYEIEVHSLKGTLYLLGAMSAGQLAEDLQYAAEKPDVDFVKARHEDFIEKLDLAISLIKEAMEM